MSSYPRSMDSYIMTGGNEYMVRGARGHWYVVGTDRNGVFVVSEPGVEYRIKAAALDAARELASQSGGTIRHGC